MAAPEGPDRRTLSTTRVVFLVIAAAAPMAAMVGNVPLALVRGNGVGLPGAYLLALLVLICFAVGYAAMSRRVVNTGAFYTYVARSLGRPAGMAAAYVAVLSYAALSVGLVGAFGYFTRLVLLSEGVDLPWPLYSAVAVVVVGLLGYRSADLSAQVLGVLMTAEFGVLVVFDVLEVAHDGARALPATSFAPTHVFSGSIGISLMLAFTSFVGFESAALYGEETRDPERAIPRASYTALGAIGVFYLVTGWIIVGASGGTQAPTLAGQQLGNLIFDRVQRVGGTPLYDVAAVLLCTSVLAATLALHNAASRYLFALGREGAVPGRLGTYHPRHASPHVASLLVTAVAAVVTTVFAATGADPYTVFAASLVGLGTLGVVALQAAASVAVIAFFRGRPDRRAWSGVVAPGIGAVGLTVALVLAVSHYSTLTGSSDVLIDLVPALLAVAALAGVAVALRLRARHPAVYAQLAGSRLRGRTTATPPPAYSRRYCLVGGGPAGMVMARQLLAEGVPFDWFERHTALGGIWDDTSPGSPIYRSAHFISSKYTSGFYGAPMPATYPDYPTWRQIRDYLRDTAARFGLDRAVTLGVAVLSATPLPGDRWSVELSDGRREDYDGLIAAPGVTWHPSVPELPGAAHFRGEVRHSVQFRDGAEFDGRRVLVVGAGNSGVDIACEAARHADAAYLSVRRGYRFVPKHLFGLPTDAVLLGLLEPPKGVVVPASANELIDSVVGDLTRLGLPRPDHDVLASHPIMNTQVLHHLAHGDLLAVPDVDSLTPTGAVLADGREVDVDLVLLATGYEYRIPFLDPTLLRWRAGHPELYLNVFSREHDSLYVLGFIEFADAAYKRFDEMAQLVVMDLRARETGEHRAAWRELKADDAPDLRGGVAYVDSPRHTSYVDSATYQRYLAGLRDRFGWPSLDDGSFDALLAPASTEHDEVVAVHDLAQAELARGAAEQPRQLVGVVRDEPAGDRAPRR